jgi:hypothetical protein
MTEYSHSRAELDAARKKLNDRSMEWATRRNVAWTTEEDAVIINEWLPKPKTADRDEEGISRKLSRTVFACQGRAEELRKLLGLTGHSHCSAAPEMDEPARPVCERCFMELPISGECGNCG